jgi:steroid 5-alpha reductase family enzyme
VSGLLINVAVTLGVAVALVLITFAAALRRGRYDLIDSLWGLGFAVVAVVTLLLSDGDLLPRLASTVLTVVWGVRLAVHIHTRNRHRDEDPRYTEILGRAGDHPKRYMVTHVYLTQAAILWFVSLPVQFAQYGHGGPTWLVWVGVAVWLVGFTFESVGDSQLRAFLAEGGKGQVMDKGLWRYTRHPNYFGDACVWWGLYLMACHSWAGFATLPAPVVMTLLLTKGTGKALLENGIGNRRPGYADYVASTSGFFPLPPKKQAKAPAQ